jgi:hypothetical protein
MDRLRGNPAAPAADAPPAAAANQQQQQQAGSSSGGSGPAAAPASAASQVVTTAAAATARDEEAAYEAAVQLLSSTAAGTVSTDGGGSGAGSAGGGGPSGAGGGADHAEYLAACRLLERQQPPAPLGGGGGPTAEEAGARTAAGAAVPLKLRWGRYAYRLRVPGGIDLPELRRALAHRIGQPRLESVRPPLARLPACLPVRARGPDDDELQACESAAIASWRSHAHHHVCVRCGRPLCFPPRAPRSVHSALFAHLGAGLCLSVPQVGGAGAGVARRARGPPRAALQVGGGTPHGQCTPPRPPPRRPARLLGRSGCRPLGTATQCPPGLTGWRADRAPLRSAHFSSPALVRGVRGRSADWAEALDWHGNGGVIGSRGILRLRLSP